MGSEERGPLHGLDAVPTPVDAVPSSQQPVSGSLSYALPPGGEQQIDTHSTVRKGALGARQRSNILHKFRPSRRYMPEQHRTSPDTCCSPAGSRVLGLGLGRVAGGEWRHRAHARLQYAPQRCGRQHPDTLEQRVTLICQSRHCYPRPLHPCWPACPGSPPAACSTCRDERRVVRGTDVRSALNVCYLSPLKVPAVVPRPVALAAFQQHRTVCCCEMACRGAPPHPPHPTPAHHPLAPPPPPPVAQTRHTRTVNTNMPHEPQLRQAACMVSCTANWTEVCLEAGPVSHLSPGTRLGTTPHLSGRRLFEVLRVTSVIETQCNVAHESTHPMNQTSCYRSHSPPARRQRRTPPW